MTFLDFFAGIGGFRMGMERAGHKCAGFIEIDKPAVKSYRAIFDTGGEFYADDIRDVMPGELPEADCWCGGFPCQSFSQAGRRGGFSDTRGTLIFEIFRLAAVCRPRVLFLENVAGLLNHDNARTFGTILTAMAELGYHVEWQCINSSAYVPQNRERVFIIGYYGGFPGRQVFPIPQQHGETLKQIIGGCQGSRIYDTSGTSCTLTSGSGGLGAKSGLYFVDLCPEGTKITDKARCIQARYNRGKWNRSGEASGVLEVRPIITPHKEKTRQKGRRIKENGEEMFTLTATDRHGIMVGGLYTGTSDNYFRPPLDEMSRCLKANRYDAGVVDGYRIRRLTPRECFRLQGFPDWAFERAAAVNSDSQLYKQAGNSVTVPVIEEIAKRLKIQKEWRNENESNSKNQQNIQQQW